MECSVCYLPYDNFSFSLHCNHALCHICYIKLPTKTCPCCRRDITFTTNKKLNLLKFNRIKRHLQFKHNLPVKRNNRNLRMKHKLLRIALGY